MENADCHIPPDLWSRWQSVTSALVSISLQRALASEDHQALILRRIALSKSLEVTNTGAVSTTEQLQRSWQELTAELAMASLRIVEADTAYHNAVVDRLELSGELKERRQ